VIDGDWGWRGRWGRRGLNGVKYHHGRADCKKREERHCGKASHGEDYAEKINTVGLKTGAENGYG